MWCFWRITPLIPDRLRFLGLELLWSEGEEYLPCFYEALYKGLLADAYLGALVEEVTKALGKEMDVEDLIPSAGEELG